MKQELIVQNDPKSPISEIFRTLRTNVQFMGSTRKLKSILVTSTVPGEGKSWVSSNLAVSFAQTGRKVVLVDADMRLGRQYKIFELSPVPGLSNYLSGIDNSKVMRTKKSDIIRLSDCLQKTKIKNLYLLPAGNIPPNPTELLVSENMTTLLKDLEKACDLIIFDGPPTSIVADPLILSRIVDTTIIVAANNITKRETIKKVVENIKKVGGKIAGIVINKAEISTKKYESSYYYGNHGTRKQTLEDDEEEEVDLIEELKYEEQSMEADLLDNSKNEFLKENQRNAAKAVDNPYIEEKVEPVEKVELKEETKEEESKEEDRVNDIILSQINAYLKKDNK